MKKEKKKTSKKVAIIIVAVIAVITIFVALTDFLTNWLWFSEVGYSNVFFTELLTKLKIGVPIFVILGILVGLYLNLLRRGYFKKIASKEETDKKKLSRITWIISAAFSLIVSWVVARDLWMQILQYTNSTDFNIQDPLYGLDVSFYIFKLDFLDGLNALLIGIIIGFFIMTLIYYAILLAVRTPDLFEEIPPTEEETAKKANSPFEQIKKEWAEGMGKTYTPKPKKTLDKQNMKGLLSIASGKLTLLGIIFFIMLAIDFMLAQFELLQAHNGTVYGAGFTDVNITVWKLRILCGLSFISAIVLGFFMKKKQYKKIAIIPVAMIAVAILGSVVGSVVQNYVVSPDELNKEKEYLGYNIEYTQYAYGLTDVTIKSFSADNTLTAQDILDNSETIENIRINDFDPAQRFYNQTQSIRQYYSFFDVDNDRYMVNGEYTQTFITAREIDENKISSTWLNMHLKYTHGYGVAMSRVDKVTSSGQPDVLIGNIPPESTVSEIKIDRPEIYFGELTNEYVIVNTNEEEFDYPMGDTNAYTKYEGTAGIKMGFLNRALFAIKEGSLKLFTSTNISSESRIIVNRNIVNRVKTIMPYLSYEGDPYLVVADGKLYWIMDAYTKSNNYPYSEPYYNNINYIRNSVKVVIDAYNGTVDFYIVDEEDPIAITMQKIYPTLFKNFSEMPDTLKSHIRYPNELFEIQARVYAKYHMEDIGVFYQSEDLWDLAYEIYETEKIQIEPNYYIAKLPGETQAEFFNSVPYTPKSKQNMTALLVARNDGDNYGELVLYQFPKSRAIYGTEQIEAQIDQNTEISKEFTLWTSAGTSYRRGNLFVIPINNSILYVEPVYLEAQNSSIPEVKRIIMAYNDQIAYGETLKDCLVQLFGQEAVDGKTSDNPGSSDKPGSSDNPGSSDKPGSSDNPGGSDNPGTSLPDPNEEIEALVTKANQVYDKAQTALKKGDWTGYGEYMEELEKVLEELEKASAKLNN